MLSDMFHVRREELPCSIAFILLIIFLQSLIISKFFVLFADYSDHNWDVFMNNFHMSGFDPITYSVLTDWHQGYDIVRHPLLAIMMYPLYLINQVLWWITGINCCQIIVGLLLILSAFYSYIFLNRIFVEVIGLRRADSTILSFFFFGFAYILVAILVPDHFALSLFCLLFTLYLGGKKCKEGKYFSLLESLLLFSITSAVTLSNGVSVFLIIMIVNGKRMLDFRYLLIAFALPSFLLLSIAVGIKFSMGDVQAPVAEQMNWIKENVSRWDVAYENFLGESIQLHRKYILGDVLAKRPVIVKYSWTIQYVIEMLIVGLFVIGAWIGKRNRIIWMVFAVLAFNVGLHLILGFAIDEVYIMACHWAFCLPIVIGFIFKSKLSGIRLGARISCLLLTGYLWAYHGFLLYRYLTWPLHY